MMSLAVHQKGSSLVEVLVAFFIMAIGLLGLAGMQTVALKGNHNAQLRTYGNILAYDLADRMRSNLTAVSAGTYDDQDGAAVSNCSTTTGCSSSQMAANDVYEWKQSIASNLPDGSSTICLDSTPDDGTSSSFSCDGAGDIYAIKVFWTDDSLENDEQRTVVSFTP